MILKTDRNSINPLLLLHIYLVLVSGVFAVTPHSPSRFWEEEIDKAIEKRNSIFLSLVTESNGLDIAQWDSKIRKNVAARIELSSISSPTWHQFIKGVIFHLQGNESSETFFTQALTSSENDPGTTWLLFTEFNRYNLTAWIERSLIQLEKQLYISGGNTSILISRQLLHYGFIHKKNHDDNRAQQLYTWAHRFNPHETASLLFKARSAIPNNPFMAIQALSHYFQVIAHSWIAQMTFIHFWYTFIRQLLITYIFIIVTIFCIKYFPQALHRFVHIFPGNVALGLRTVFVSGIIISLLSFGVLPFLLLVSIILWSFLTRTEKGIYTVVLVGILLAPFDSGIIDRFYHALDPDGSIITLSNAINEGYSSHLTSPSLPSGDTSKVVLSQQLGAAYSAVKKNEYTRSINLINRLALRYPTDPVVNTMKGIAYYYTGAIDSAQFYFTKIITLYPNNVYAQFNLARCFFASNDATTGMEVLKTAADLQPTLINKFVEENDRYFSGKWPTLRLILLPNYTPLEFWKRIFFSDTKDSSTQRTLWGLSFFGLSPLISFFVFIILMLLMLSMQKRHLRDKKLRRLFECKYCGKIICRKCTTGILCASCAHTTHYRKETQTLEQVRGQIVKTFSLWRSLRNSFFNLLVPGAGMFFQPQPRISFVIIGITIATFVYTYWIVVLRNTTFSGKSIFEIGIYLFIPVLFHLYCVIRYVPTCFQHLSTLLKLSFSKKGA